MEQQRACFVAGMWMFLATAIKGSCLSVQGDLVGRRQCQPPPPSVKSEARSDWVSKTAGYCTEMFLKAYCQDRIPLHSTVAPHGTLWRDRALGCRSPSAFQGKASLSLFRCLSVPSPKNSSFPSFVVLFRSAQDVSLRSLGCGAHLSEADGLKSDYAASPNCFDNRSRPIWRVRRKRLERDAPCLTRPGTFVRSPRDVRYARLGTFVRSPRDST